MTTKAAENHVKNVEMDGSVYSVGLCCEYQGARYHVWLNPKTFQPIDKILYKNAIEPEKFETRCLDQDGATGKIVVPAMLAEVNRLIPPYRAELKLKSDESAAWSEYWERVELLKMAAPDQNAALKPFAALDFGKPIAAQMTPDQWISAISAARAAIAKSEIVR